MGELHIAPIVELSISPQPKQVVFVPLAALENLLADFPPGGGWMGEELREALAALAANPPILEIPDYNFLSIPPEWEDKKPDDPPNRVFIRGFVAKARMREPPASTRHE